MEGYILDFEKPLVELRKKIDDLKKFESEKKIKVTNEIQALEKRAEKLRDEIYNNLTPYQIFQIMRHPKRPRTLDYIERIFSDFLEIHGDRSYADDKALIGGLAKFEGKPVMLLGLQKGRDTKENLLRKFGMAQPEGYRKALRIMKLAEKFKLPLISFIDTMGAFPGVESEERGVAEAIARNLFEMSKLKTPILIIVIGEGGSGGALGIGVGDRILMLKYATYSVISFEGCAAIIWKDSTKAPDAAKALKPTAKDLLELGVIDEIIDEPLEGAHTDFELTASNIKNSIDKNLKELEKIDINTLIKQRYEKYSKLGISRIEQSGEINEKDNK
ncbi:MAG: acetyl-CoA carboxylase carboxyltransferase subunit alpha [Candidatus Goldbacteria bacterium]|nr:acetyl-CoA carboxylase carboxyltransferase subunit alpha [Candidatus Goldiibacteriota bacterium]